MALALRCELEKSVYAANAASYARAASAASAASYTDDKYLILIAQIALSILKELNSPGCVLL